MPPVSLTIRVSVLFFGQIKELLGRAQDSIDVAASSSIEDLFQQVAAGNSELQKFRGSVVASRNREFAPWNTLLRAGDEVAFLPPVSGG